MIALVQENRRTRAVEVEVTELLGPSSGIVVSGAICQLASWKCERWSLLESLVMLDETDQSLLLGDINQLLVVFDFLSSGLGNKDVMTEVQSFGSNWEMSRIGCENDDC